MPKRAASESNESLSPKEEPSTPPPTTPKKAKKSPSTPSPTGSRSKMESPGYGMQGSLARTARGRYMELVFEAGLKAIDKKAVQDETGLSLAQQKEMMRKDKGPLRKAVGGFVGGL